MAHFTYECPECWWQHPDKEKFCPVCWHCRNCLLEVGHVDPETYEPVTDHGGGDS